ncbi:methyltransferase type 11 [Niabella ginsenosidivorans]|uniref:Methyltransferase type 11 n=1 Tax=Niabella ginsenosidivorans TaxID=1176587 RepID=A0A1A9IBU8_9BACT|nr:class I SAM-dependent methyltransferase [Niabella ginsenosidivorans]ANH84044.1 methyltransferase type 11 [Niabella ginsenosidivorans]
MEIWEAKNLIKPLEISCTTPQRWADLGCGSGTFTYALADLLPPYSTIYAFDKKHQVFKEPGIQFFQLDFEKHSLPVPPLSGILMANSLHFVEDQLELITKLKEHLSLGGALVLVEYDTHQSSKWVPYPVPPEKAKKLAALAGFKDFKLLATKKSIFQGGEIYAMTFTNNT